MLPTVCRCCGQQMAAHHQGANPNLCADCERLLEDDSPVAAAQALQQDLADTEPKGTPAAKSPGHEVPQRVESRG